MRSSRFKRRADHRDPAGAGGGGSDGGCLPQARHQQRDVLQVEGEVRRAGGVGRPAAEGARGREREAEEAAGRGDARQRHAEGHRDKKMVTPVARREAVAHLQPDLRGEPAAGVQSDRGGSHARSAIAAGGRTMAPIRARLRELAAEPPAVRLSAPAHPAPSGGHAT